MVHKIYEDHASELTSRVAISRTCLLPPWVPTVLFAPMNGRFKTTDAFFHLYKILMARSLIDVFLH